MTDYPRGHDMSEMGHLTLPGATAAYIAKLEARIAALEIVRDDAHGTIRRLADENAALKALLADLGGEEPEVNDGKLGGRGGVVLDSVHGAGAPAGGSAIYGTDFPECTCPQESTQVCDVCQGPAYGTDRLVTRWRNGKRYELTPEDARLFDEGEE